MKDKPAEASILDAIGSEVAENSAEQANNIIAERAKGEGFETTPRFSCGYGDWDIQDQKKILELVGASEIGISANEASLMEPRKSVTALVGWC